MEKAYDKQDLNRFFNGIKTKYVIPRPDTNIIGKVTCRNGLEYIEKPYNNTGGYWFLFFILIFHFDLMLF
jgi:hypothetical protein